MNKLGKKLAAAGICVCMAATFLSGCGSLNGNDAVATLDGENVSLGLANFMLRFNQAQMESSYGSMFGDDMWNTDLMGAGTPYGITFKTQIISDLEQMLILEKHMSEYKISLSDEEKKSISDAAKKFMEENTEDTLKAMTATEETVNRMLTLYTEKTKMYNAIIKDVDTNVTDDEAAQKTIQYVLFSTADTTDADGTTVSMTEEEKAAAKEKAQKLLDAVKGGKTMEDALKEVDSEMTVSSASYGTDDTAVKDELKTAGDKLKDGETADGLVEAEGGYYVVQMKSTFDQEATNSKKESIVSQRKTDKFDEVYNGWKDAAKFELKEKVWEKATFTDKMKVKQTETQAASGQTETETAAGTKETTKEGTGTEAEGTEATMTEAVQGTTENSTK